ncbi:MAG: PIG-L family deacetylase [Acidimicrobiia bacterium]|nr:PIG-L family deacetylase [Acidimicrobiia bacterium]
MGTLVLLHAHPDDEAIATGGTMARAAAEGHRVVLVCATRGELGEVADGFLDDGETLADRRAVEVHAAAAILGAQRVAFLDYRDSGMEGEPTATEPGCFAMADVDEAAARLAKILVEEDAEVLTVYDERGNYGHPDHVQVHHVGIRAAELAGTARVYEATINRDHFLALMAERSDEMAEFDDAPNPDEMNLGMPAEVITTTIDVREFIDRKRAAMAAHSSQITGESFFMKMPEDAFVAAFGQEWYIRRGPERAAVENTLFPAR